MTNIEKLFNDDKKELDKLEIPEEMEARLRNTLDNIPNRNRKNKIRGKVAILIIAVLFIGYNADTLAYYAKQFIGYDRVMNGTLQELNELGKGQIIDKSYTFENGAKVTLDGIMLDDNNLIVFYTIFDPNGNADNIRINQIEGLFGIPYNYSGHGEISQDRTEMKWVMTCDKPKFYERSMKLKAYLKDSNETGEVKFILDRNQAMGNSLKIEINKELELDLRKINIESLVASPTSTVISGQIQNIVEIAIDQIKGERFMPEKIDILLIVDGKEVNRQGSGMLTDSKGSRFNISYDALPSDMKGIELRLTSFGGNHDVNEIVKLEKGIINKDIKMLQQDIRINEVYESEGNTYISFTSDEDLALNRTFLNIDGERKSVEKTITGDYDKIVNGDSVKVNYTRTIEFKGTGEDLELNIQRIRYGKTYYELIYKYNAKE